MENENIKKVNPNEENEVQDTSGGEMPNPLKKMADKATDAAKAFEQRVNPKTDPKKADPAINKDVDQDDEDELTDDEQKKAG